MSSFPISSVRHTKTHDRVPWVSKSFLPAAANPGYATPLRRSGQAALMQSLDESQYRKYDDNENNDYHDNDYVPSSHTLTSSRCSTCAYVTYGKNKTIKSTATRIAIITPSLVPLTPHLSLACGLPGYSIPLMIYPKQKAAPREERRRIKPRWRGLTSCRPCRRRRASRACPLRARPPRRRS